MRDLTSGSMNARNGRLWGSEPLEIFATRMNIILLDHRKSATVNSNGMIR